MPDRECHEEVTRKGQTEPCDKVAVAYRIDPAEGTPYRVCVGHTRGDMVPLAVLELRGRALAAIDAAGKARIEALTRWLLDKGHLTPVGARQIRQVLDHESDGTA